MVAAFEPWADCDFKIKDTKNRSKALKLVQENSMVNVRGQLILN